MEASVPVFGNCCLDLPADSDGVSEDNVFADVDASVDSDSEGAVLGFITSSSVLVKSAPGITAVLPDGVVTVALPLSSTTTVEPGLTALTLSSITFFSSGVKAFGSDTTVLSAGVTMSLPSFGLVVMSPDLVKSTPGITAVLPDGVVTVVVPLLVTTTIEPGLTALTLSSITFFSSRVKAFGSDTTVLSAGVFIEVLVLVDALWLADVLADWLALVDADSDADVLADWLALVDADSDADVLADWLALVDAD